MHTLWVGYVLLYSVAIFDIVTDCDTYICWMYNICLAEIIKGFICQTHTFCTLAFLTFFFITLLAQQKLVAPTVKLDELENSRVHLSAKAGVSRLHEQSKMGTIVREPLIIKRLKSVILL